MRILTGDGNDKLNLSHYTAKGESPVKELVELLKQARQEKKISLAEISEQTRIQRHYLEALESGRFDRFPGEVYLKGALRNYAEAVELDPVRVLALYHKLAAKTLPGEPAAPPPPARTERRPVRTEKGPSLIYGFIVLALAVVIGSYWFLEQYWPRKTPEPPPANGSAGLVEETPAPSESEEPGAKPGGEDPAPPEPSVALTLLETESTTQETVFSVESATPLELELTCSARCWIKALADGGEPFPPRNFQQEETASVQAEERIWIRLGNPPGAVLKINGVAVKAVEERKHAHSFLFIREQED